MGVIYTGDPKLYSTILQNFVLQATRCPGICVPLTKHTYTNVCIYIYIYIYISCTHTALSANKSDNISEKLKARFSFFHDIVQRQFITYVSGQRVGPISRSQDVGRSKESSWKFDFSVNAP